ncbi:hypothetical protein [Arhodomonas sp. SL1]|uniref:hypothetical protein n=1 Tax=Arhodomonas sp. SL1 TaxID=3425691 RepID=UPI003F8853F3
MRLLMIFAFMLATFHGAAHATTIFKMDFNQVTRAADGIVVGTVTDIDSRKAEDGIIYSFISLNDLELLGGRYAGETFTLRIEGGRVGGEVQEIAGAPDFREGERVIVFVEGNGERIVPIAGWHQGLFRVITDPETGTDYIADALGNRIYGVRDGDLIKESRFGTEAEIFGQGGGGGSTGAAQSEGPQANFGEIRGGRAVQPGDAGTEPTPMMEMQAQVGEPLTFEAFRSEIGAQMEAADVGEMATLTSASSEELPQGRFDDAAPARTPPVEEPVEQAPAEQGDVPRRIAPGSRPNLDTEE